MAQILWMYGTDSMEVWHKFCGGKVQVLWTYGTDSAEVWRRSGDMNKVQESFNWCKISG